MVTLFNKFQKLGDIKRVKDEDSVNEVQEVKPIEPEVDEVSLKKSIAAKLERYQPVEREANFTGPKYYQ